MAAIFPIYFERHASANLAPQQRDGLTDFHAAGGCAIDRDNSVSHSDASSPRRRSNNGALHYQRAVARVDCKLEADATKFLIQSRLERLTLFAIDKSGVLVELGKNACHRSTKQRCLVNRLEVETLDRRHHLAKATPMLAAIARQPRHQADGCHEAQKQKIPLGHDG